MKNFPERKILLSFLFALTQVDVKKNIHKIYIIYVDGEHIVVKFKQIQYIVIQKFIKKSFQKEEQG